MFDLGRIGEAISGFLGDKAQDVIGGNPLELLQSTGLSPELLQGLDAQQIVELLSQNGIDLGALAPDQLQALAGSLNIDPTQFGNLGSMVSGFLERR